MRDRHTDTPAGEDDSPPPPIIPASPINTATTRPARRAPDQLAPDADDDGPFPDEIQSR